jgi:mono/diheme cytochrome c family protein
LRLLLAISAAAVALFGCAKGEGPSRPLTTQEARGERLYQATCAACHRANSTDPLNGPGLKGLYKKPYLPSGAPTNDERVTEVIKHGRRMMPGYGQVYVDEQIAELVAYLKTL